jgi:hypothetical protein
MNRIGEPNPGTGSEATATTMPPKLYTPALANKTLPLVRSIVDDILDRAKELRGLQVLSRAPAEDEEVQRVGREVKELMAELEKLGCHFKDWSFEVGLVDFPAEIDGREVYLCWKTDEPRVEWFHPVTGSFNDRERIPADLLES